MRHLTVTVVASLVLAACGGGGSGEDAVGTPVGPASTEASTSASRSGGTGASGSTTATRLPAPAGERDERERERERAERPPSRPTRSTTGTTAPSTTSNPAPPTSPAPPPTPPTPPTPPASVDLPDPIAPPEDAESSEPVVPLGTLAIPKIGLERTMYEGIRLPTFDLGPGHWPGSAMPGQRGNMIVGGHRTSANADFRYLDALAPGDEMIMTTNDGATHTYRVDSVEITDPFALRILEQTAARTATLFACHPPGSIRQRIVVHLTLT